MNKFSLVVHTKIMITKKDIAHNLRALRKEHDYSQEQVAEFIGIKRSSYANYEIGATEMNYSTLTKIIELYGVDPNELFSVASIPNKNLKTILEMEERFKSVKQKEKYWIFLQKLSEVYWELFK